ncbi:MAG: inositol monophosphatase [Neorhizobium sp.]|nr:inositol monophosphatase [Neorhizobium sp.]
MQDQEMERGISERFGAAKRIIRAAGQIALEYFANYDDLEIETKTSRQDTVSVADKEVETFIRAEIAKLFPLDGLIGEEHGEMDGDSDYTWVIDPIDGTACFLHGLKSWCTVIALLKNGEPVAGLIYDATGDALYSAVRGFGAYRDERRISVDLSTPLAGSMLAIGASRPEQSAQIGGLIAAVLGAGGVYMRNGSAALTLAHVAAGHYGGYYEPALSSWDCLAGLLIVSEAGGVADDFLAHTNVTGRGPAFAAAPQVAGEFQALIASGV